MSELIGGWRVERGPTSREQDRATHACTFVDPGTGLQVRWVATAFEAFPAVELILHIRNDGRHDSPILENVQALDARFPCVGGRCVLHYARGAMTCPDDFAPVRRVLGTPSSTIRVTAGGGRSSSEHTQNVRSIVAHDLPVDYYWIDAEWFGASPWWQNTGTWEVRKDVYPRGLKPLSDILHSSGRKLMLWFEPHRVSAGSRWYREHEEWLLKVGKEDVCRSWPHWVDMDDPRWRYAESNRNEIAEGDALLNIGIPAARELLTDAVSRIIEENGIDCYREDFNIAPLSFWRKADATDRQGMTEIRWVEGLYASWDELLRRHPGLIIDNCASGGRRIDIETLGRATPFWRSDFPSGPVAQQCQAHGIMHWVPQSSIGRALIGKDDAYALRSAMCTSLLVFFDERGDGPNPDPIPDSFPFDLARRNLESYREIQHFFYGDYYPLTEYSQAEDAWMVYQLDRPDLGEGLVVALRRPRSSFSAATFALQGLEKAASYEITDRDTGERMTTSGESLSMNGLEVRLAGRPDSKLISYRRLARRE